jgi:ring-1,2-phenylacetyl-CoA epoxidase subunit PaaD
VVSALTEERAWKALRTVVDPEIPVLSIVEMRLVSRIEVDGSSATVHFTPSFSGCPAIAHIKERISESLQQAGFTTVRVETDYATAWSTDLLDASAKEKLRAFGVAPPGPTEPVLADALARTVPCPMCGSAATHLESAFGPTLCKQIFYCDGCRQSFERFKPL